jgi:LysM repeat protein
MADDDKDLPESAEEQYLQWVGQVQSESQQEGSQPSRVTGSELENTGVSPSHGVDTLVAIPSVFPRPVVTTARDLFSVESGQPVRIKVTVRNVGPVVEGYSLSIVGMANAWANIVPQDISLFPGDEAVATIIIKPPRASKILAGDYTIGIRARSEVDPNESTVHEFVVQVKPFYESNLALSKTTIDIKSRTTSYAQVTNSGNSDVEFSLATIDPDGNARCQIEKPDFVLAPGETTWKKMTIKADRHIIGRPRSLSLVGTLSPLRDVSSEKALTEIKPLVQRVNLLQKALIRFRLGPLGKILLLLLVLALVAAFLLSRYLLGPSNDIKSGPPATPSGFSATLYETNEALLRWEGAGGATGYSIYAVGETGNALSETPSPSGSPSASAVLSSTKVQFEFSTFPVPLGGENQTTAPSPNTSDSSEGTDPSSPESPSPNEESLGTGLSIESPSCGDCTHVKDVPSGTTRLLVTKTVPGVPNCYRIVATDGKAQSLFTPQKCVDIPDASNASSADGSGGNGSPAPIPCPPKEPRVDKISDSVLAVTWQMPSETKKKESKTLGCDPKLAPTGFEVQRQIMSGWATWSPSPLATDTAVEITGLQPSTPYCFRMRSASSGQYSSYTENVCKKTKKLPAISSPEPSAESEDSGISNGPTGTETSAAATEESSGLSGQSLEPRNDASLTGGVKIPDEPNEEKNPKKSKSVDNQISEIVVSSGDVLWLIAEEYSSSGDSIERTIRKIMKLNGLKSQIIWPGQVLKIPK